MIGHRRLVAARQAGLSTVPVIVEKMDACREREIMHVENTQRSDLTPAEEADGYQGLLDLGVRVKEMAEKTGHSDRFVRRRLKIARIPQETHDMSVDFSQLSPDQLDKLAEFESDPTCNASSHGPPTSNGRTKDLSENAIRRNGAVRPTRRRQGRRQGRVLPGREGLLDVRTARLQAA